MKSSVKEMGVQVNHTCSRLHPSQTLHPINQGREV
jgi:hypothetical protein